MRKLPLYTEPPQAYIASIQPVDLDPGCTKCSFSQGTINPCMGADGTPGGVLILGESPTVKEDQIGRPFSGEVGRYLRTKVSEFSKEPIIYDNALRCPTKGNKVGATNLEPCGGYLAGVVRQADPTRILCLGATAAEAILNRRPIMGSVNRGYGWYFKGHNKIPVPVFFLESPSYTNKNRFMQASFEANLEWALTCPIPTPDFAGVTNLVDDEIDSMLAFEALSDQPWIAYDVETSGKMHNPDFQLEAVTLLGAHASEAWTWTRASLKNPTHRSALKELFETGNFVTQNGKYDDRAVELDLGAVVKNIEGDTRLVRKMLDPEARASLEVMGELVGLGGHKEASQEATAFICKELNRQANPPSALTPKGKPRKIAPPKFYVDPSILEQIREGSEPMAFAFHFVEEEILYQYNARDVWTTRALWRILNSELQENLPIKRMWDLVTRDANKAVKQIESWGFPVDKSALQSFRDFCDHKLTECGAKLAHYGECNFNSPKQLGELLYGTLGLPALVKTETGANATNEEALEGLKGRHPIVEDLITWRKYSKLKGTYGDGMLSHVRADGRIHPSFLLDGAETGRMSSSDPNFQNCFTGDTEVLTKVGWQRFDSLTRGEPVAQYSPESREIEFVKPLAYQVLPNSQNLVHIHNRNIDLAVTPEHRCLLRRRARAGGGHFEVPASGYKEDFLQINSGKYLGGNVAPGDDFIRLLVATQADGSYHDGGLDFSFKKERKIERLIGILNRLAIPYTSGPRPSRPAYTRIRVLKSPTVDAVRERLGSTKTFGWWVLNYTPNALKTFIDELWYWDGLSTRKNCYFSTIKVNADVVQAALHLSGYRAHIRPYRHKHTEERHKTLWVVEVSFKDYSMTTNVCIDTMQDVGMVYCLSVPSTYIVVRRNDKICITGNCPRANGSEEGKLFRDCFIAKDGWCLLEADFSQLEIRIAAMLSGDKNMTQDFLDGIDIHRNNARAACQTAWGISQVDWDKMSKDEQDPYRSKIKCFHPDVEVLTKAGWRKIKDTNTDTEVMQAIPGKGGKVELSWAKPTEVFTANHPSKKLVHLKSNTIDLHVTPDHRMLLWPTKTSNFEVVYPEAFNKGRHWASAGTLHGGQKVDLNLLRLAVALQADGHIKDHGSVSFGFSKQRKKDRLRQLLTVAQIEFAESDYADNVTHFRIRASDALPFRNFLETTKAMPWSWLGLDFEARSTIVDEASFWDSHIGPQGRRYQYSSTVQQNVDVLQAIAASVGRKSAANGPNLSVKDRHLSRSGSVDIAEYAYDGEVACIAVPSTFVLVRQNGIPIVCGQTLTFGRLYGKSDAGIAYEWGVKVDEVRKINQAIWGRYKQLDAWIKEKVVESRRTGEAHTWWMGQQGRRRFVWKIADPDQGIREHGERTAYNGPIQGTAADFMTASLWPIIQYIQEEGIPAEVICTVHDSVTLHVNRDYLKEVAFVVQKTMTSWPSNGVPIKVDMKVGTSWGSMVDYKGD